MFDVERRPQKLRGVSYRFSDGAEPVRGKSTLEKYILRKSPAFDDLTYLDFLPLTNLQHGERTSRRHRLGTSSKHRYKRGTKIIFTVRPF